MNRVAVAALIAAALAQGAKVATGGAWNQRGGVVSGHAAAVTAAAVALVATAGWASPAAGVGLVLAGVVIADAVADRHTPAEVVLGAGLGAGVAFAVAKGLPR